jgi:hypothetical protein
MDCELCGTDMDWKKAHYECPQCHWIKPCCEGDLCPAP